MRRPVPRATACPIPRPRQQQPGAVRTELEVALPLAEAVTEALTLGDSLALALADAVALPLGEAVAATEDVALALEVCAG